MTEANPLAHPQHWARQRPPRNEAERDFIAAWSFTPVAELEQALWVREHAPDLFDQVAVEYRTTLVAYEAKRRIAVEHGREIAGLASDDDLRAAADVVRREDPADAKRAYDAGRREFRRVVSNGDYPYRAWRAWQDACYAAAERASASASARRALGLRGGYNLVTGGLGPADLLTEIQRATGGGGSMTNG
jgi:hypothetical protein